MNYILTGGINLITDKIVSIFSRGNTAIATDVTGREHILLKGSQGQVNSYVTELLKALTLTELPEVEYHWFDLVGGDITIPEGTALLPDLKYDGVDVTPSAITYETTTQNVSIFKDGKVFGLQSGTTKAKVSKDGTELSFNINVVPSPNFGLYDSPDTVIAGRTEDMIIRYNGIEVPAKACVWKSYDTGKFTVDNGVVTGVAQGKAYISCTYAGVEYIKELTVHPTAPSPDSENKTLKVEETYDANMPSRAGFSGEKWVSENEEVATVNSANGNITAVKSGTAKIVGRFTSPYTTEGKIVNLTVQPKAPTPEQKTGTVKVGGATLQGVMPTVDGFSGAKWVSANSDKATVVEGTGVITAVAEGTATITGKFTQPYETDAVVYTVTVQPADAPQP